MSLFLELKRRNILRVAAAYTVVAWIIIQAAETIFPLFGIGDTPARIVVMAFSVGLIPVLVISWVFELTPQGLKREKEVDRSHSVTLQTGKQLDRWIIVLLVLGLSYFAFDKFMLEPVRDAKLIDTTTQLAQQSVMNRTPEKSIAVLSFVNMSADPDQDFFSDGISEAILNSLAQVQAFKVAGRTSSFAFKGRNEDLRIIGEALNVAHVLEGSVRKSGNQLRITAQLINVESGYHIWSETFDRELTDVFAIQDEIARAILGRLKSELLGEELEIRDAARTNTEVYELYLKARQLIYERHQPALGTAAKLLDRAIIFDPEYAPAHAQRGITWLLLSEKNYGDIPFEYAQDQAKQQLDIALSLDPRQAEALAGLGFYYKSRVGESSKAVEMLETALSINPNLINARNWLNSAKAIGGDEAGALAIIEKLIDLDPLYGPGLSNAVQMYNRRGSQNRSWALLKRVKPFSQDQNRVSHSEAGTYFSLGQFARGLSLMNIIFENQPNNHTFRLEIGKAWNATHQFERLAEDGTKYYQSLAFWQLGQLEEALIAAYEIADSGEDVDALFGILNATGRSADLITYLDKHWESVNEIPIDGSSENGYLVLSEVALAYLRAGEQEKSDLALRLIRLGHDNMISQGWSNIDFSFNEAVYHALSGNVDLALEHLSDAVDNGYIGPNPLSKFKPAFEIFVR